MGPDKLHPEKIRIADIRYNPERAGFEALVTIHDGAVDYRYPGFVAAPMHAEYALITRGLSERALAAHRSGAPGLRAYLRRLVKPAATAPELPPLAA